MNRWLWVSLPYATFGINVRDGHVVDAAPIAWWMRGKSIGYIETWITRKGGRMVWLPEEQPNERKG